MSQRTSPFFWADESIRSQQFGQESVVLLKVFSEAWRYMSLEEAGRFPKAVWVRTTKKSFQCCISRSCSCVKWKQPGLQKDILFLFTWLLFCISYPTAPVFLPCLLERYSWIYQQIELKLVEVHGFFSFMGKKEKPNFLQKVENFSR